MIAIFAWATTALAAIIACGVALFSAVIVACFFVLGAYAGYFLATWRARRVWDHVMEQLERKLARENEYRDRLNNEVDGVTGE